VTTFDPTGPLPSGTLVLEASAGTGKTTAIAGLAARFVVERGVPLSHLMIATFSGASTRELRARVREVLEQVERVLAGTTTAISGSVAAHLAESIEEQPTRLGRVREALAAFDSATICTTHQFCDRMLAELGVLVDHEPGTTLVDDLSELRTQVTADQYLIRYADARATPFDLTTANLLGDHAAVRSAALPLAPTDATGLAAERVSFADAVRREVERRKRLTGVYTFDDMQLRLRDALISQQGPLAREILRGRFPVVLIDEFQDTDPVQWDIVRHAFAGASTVVLIGDPKQSIYGFRGADVYAYLTAVTEHTVATLDTNHRSDPRVVNAVTRLFAGAELGDPRIIVRDVDTTDTAPSLVTHGPWAAPVRLRFSDCEAELTRQQATNAIDADLTADIAALLSSSSQLHRPRDGSVIDVAPRHVAVIVSTNRRGESLRDRLAGAGIPAVFSGSSSVFSSQAAKDWQTLLVAFAHPRTPEVRAVALTDFVRWTPAELANADSTQVGELSQLIRTWRRVAATHGMAALFETMTSIDQITTPLLAERGGDRVVTDLRHVAELLQARQSRDRLGLEQLLAWLDDQMERGQSSRDERSRRLETDADAVQVMTVHQAKGLQYPIVYVPEMTTTPYGPRTPASSSAARKQDWTSPYQVHLALGTGSTERFLDVGGSSAEGAAERLAAHQAEEAGEDLRELYVALTRAECHLTMWWVPSAHTAASPLHRVLFRDTNSAHVPVELPVTARRPDAIGRLTGSEIRMEPMRDPAPGIYQPPSRELVPAARFTRDVDLSWRRTSYSALTANAHHDLGDDGLLVDEPPDPDDALPPEAGDEPIWNLGVIDHLAVRSPMADLPGGVAFGSLVHAVFESFDPSDPGSLTDIVRAETARLPVPDVTVAALVDAMLPALDTPLGPLFDGLRLKDIPARDRLPELDFELPLGTWGERQTRNAAATMAQLSDLLARHIPRDHLLGDYPERLRDAGLATDPLRGFLTGSVDACVRVGERVVVIDYKTNRLGPRKAELTLGHYTPEAMAEAMMSSHYPLQALLYSVAMHRFLRWRWRDYDPAVQLGGIAYLFVRGMAGASTPVVDGMPTGVFTWLPPADLVTELSDLLAGAGGRS